MKMADLQVFDPAALLVRIDEATRCLLGVAEELDDAAMRADSRLPGWSRGHVLTHVARNADGGRRLLSWARSGVEAHEYPSPEARAQEIEDGAGRGAAELLADVRASADRFAEEYARMPPAAWDRELRWTAGQRHRAARVADSRLAELRLHCVDLAAGYTPEQWPPCFTEELLPRVVAALDRRADAPAMRLHATDAGVRYAVGAGGPLVEGSQSALLGWLAGRSDGADLRVAEGDRLPLPPALY
ncbi:maleylpyruvate isomerase family mycothiol-dependent enzyme [Streptacidiphilus sp. 4-A2]|nr:maleylpyruvate isomerase family mycothiol-dependent enzyme [Streptacidiphilus sp. 4-A2]